MATTGTDKLSDAKVKTAKPKEAPYKLTDGGGMYLLVEKNGSKYWRLAYRFNGKQKTLALGVYPDVSLSAARDRRLDARTLLANDIDPGIERKIQSAARDSAADGPCPFCLSRSANR